MTHYLRVTSAIALFLMLSACIATTPSDKPRTTTSAVTRQNPACLTQTGSRIPDNGTNCSASARSYSRDDINRTGATTAGDALPLLDPSITVHH
jgi:hypothetical protein